MQRWVGGYLLALTFLNVGALLIFRDAVQAGLVATYSDATEGAQAVLVARAQHDFWIALGVAGGLGVVQIALAVLTLSGQRPYIFVLDLVVLSYFAISGLRDIGAAVSEGQQFLMPAGRIYVSWGMALLALAIAGVMLAKVTALVVERLAAGDSTVMRLDGVQVNGARPLKWVSI